MAKVHEMPVLPYAMDALAPYIGEETMNYHYGKHLQAYVDNTNKLIVGTEFENAELEDIVKKAPQGGLYNNAAQALNHRIYFLSFSPKGQKTPSGKLKEAIDRDFGSFEQFKEEFSKQALALFGAGWAWLAKDNAGKLSIVCKSNAGNPLSDGLTPIMGMDVWEHAYYLDYRNRRADSVKATWEILDWKVIGNSYEK